MSNVVSSTNRVPLNAQNKMGCAVDKAKNRGHF